MTDTPRTADVSAAPARRLRIAYLCDHSPLNRNLYSGGNARIYAALNAHVGDVDILGQGWGLAEPVRRLMHRLPDAINLRLRWRLHLAFGRLTARAVRRALLRGDYDVLFCAYSFASLHRVVPPPGVLSVFTSDATQTIYRNSVVGENFGSYFAPSRLLDPWITRAEARTYRATDLLLWPSDWLHRAADETYDLRPGHAMMVPWGANIETPDMAPVQPVLARDTPLRLVFIGRDWWAKGGPMVLSILEELRARGVDARLTVIGTTPPEVPANLADHVTVHPSLDKSRPDELAVFQAALRAAHFMVLPSFESYGFAFCEASAHGTPSLCLKAGGVPVWDARNGHALPPDAPAQDFVRVVEGYLAEPETYDALRLSTRHTFDTDLNWDAWGRRVAALVAERRASGTHRPGI